MSCTVIDWNLVENTFIAKNTEKQECIPVGCVQSTAVAAWGGVSQHALGRGVCIPVCTGQGGVCVCQHALGMGVSLPRECLPEWGCLSVGGVSAPVHAGIHTPLWTE